MLILDWDQIQEREGGYKPYLHRPIIKVHPDHRLEEVAQRQKGIVRIRIAGTGGVYDGEWWAQVYPLPHQQKVWMLVIRGQWLGYPFLHQRGTVEVLDQFTLHDLPQGMFERVLHPRFSAKVDWSQMPRTSLPTERESLSHSRSFSRE